MQPSALEARTATAAHDHAVCIYDRTEDLVKALGRFVRDGLEADELVVFVHSCETTEEAWALVELGCPGAREREEVVVVSLYRDAFEGKGTSIDPEHAAAVVAGLVADAAKAGRRGVRVFVDASRRYFDAQRHGEWFAFEAWLGRRLHHAVALVCAYPRRYAHDPRVLTDMLRTHAYRFEA